MRAGFNQERAELSEVLPLIRVELYGSQVGLGFRAGCLRVFIIDLRE